MTCAMCAPTARRGRTGRVSAASPTAWIPSGSRGRRWRTRYCRRRSSAPGRTGGLMSCISCWCYGTTGAARFSPAASTWSTRPSSCCASCRSSCASSCPTARPFGRGWRRCSVATDAGAMRRRRGCACRSWTATTRRSRHLTARRSRSPPPWRSSCARAARRWASSAACRPGRSPSCWSRPATRAASPRAAFAASTPPHRCRPRPQKDRASRSGIATTRAATGGSTRSCTGWLSPSCAASRAPRQSTPAPAPAGTPRRRPAAS